MAGFTSAVGCNACGKTIPTGTAICPHCGRSQANPNIMQGATSATELTPAARREILDATIARYSAMGYRLQSQTDTTAQLVRPKRFSIVLALIGLLIAVVGLIVYLLIYLAQKDSVVFVQVDSFGKVTAS